MTSSTQSHYSSTAYRSDNSAPLPAGKRCAAANPNNEACTPLRFGHYAYLEPVTNISYQLEFNVHHDYARSAKLYEDFPASCNASRWIFFSADPYEQIFAKSGLVVLSLIWFCWIPGLLYFALSHGGWFGRGAGLVVFAALLSIVMSMTSTWLCLVNTRSYHVFQMAGLVLSTAALLWLTGSLQGTSIMHFSYWCGAFLYFMSPVGLDLLLKVYRHYSLFHPAGEIEFWRIDGMVRCKRRLRRLLEIPFEEFDAVLRTVPHHFGLDEYRLSLRHRYSSQVIDLANEFSRLNRHETFAFWDSLQRFMDVTQPLPDLPILEHVRPEDPVTAAHDAETDRPPRRWRDQQFDEWSANAEEEYTERLKRHCWQRNPCIIQARLSDSLSLKDYRKAVYPQKKTLAISFWFQRGARHFQCLPERARGSR